MCVPGFGATDLIASWHAHTPPRTWLQVEAQVVTSTGTETDWYVLGRWASGDADFRRTSVAGQDDEHASVAVDTLVMKPGLTLRSYRLRVTRHREPGAATPAVRTIGAMTSNVPDRATVRVSPPGPAAGVELPVPAHAQYVHNGRFPEYGGGGESWCGPAATQMVVEYWGRRPTEEQLSWVPADYADRTVVYAARNTYDYAYGGTGNWSFNTAYVAEFGLHGHVTRLHSLRRLENCVARGIPVVTSQSFRAGELDNAGYGSAGHLWVVVGFTEGGDVIVNDPAADDNAQVRRIYRREQFENIWLRSTGGIAYLVTP